MLMLQEVYGQEYNQSASAQRIMQQLLDESGEGREISAPMFGDFCRRHPALLYPAFLLQQTMREKLLGEAFWDRCGRQRVQLSSGEYVSLAELLAVHVSKAAFDELVNHRDPITGKKVSPLSNPDDMAVLHATGSVADRRKLQTVVRGQMKALAAARAFAGAGKAARAGCGGSGGTVAVAAAVVQGGGGAGGAASAGGGAAAAMRMVAAAAKAGASAEAAASAAGAGAPAQLGSHGPLHVPAHGKATQRAIVAAVVLQKVHGSAHSLARIGSAGDVINAAAEARLALGVKVPPASPRAVPLHLASPRVGGAGSGGSGGGGGGDHAVLPASPRAAAVMAASPASPRATRASPRLAAAAVAPLASPRAAAGTAAAAGLAVPASQRMTLAAAMSPASPRGTTGSPRAVYGGNGSGSGGGGSGGVHGGGAHAPGFKSKAARVGSPSLQRVLSSRGLPMHSDDAYGESAASSRDAMSGRQTSRRVLATH
ncbi:unnamed protein product [Phaeothamnion confervicola]